MHNHDVFTRLEPSTELRDVSHLSIDLCPITLTFWRRGSETAARHRNPLFRDPRVVSYRCIVWDELHCMNGGVYSAYVGQVLEEAIRCDVFRVGNSLDAATKRIMSVARMRGDLFAWYDKQRRERPEVPIAALSDLTPTMTHNDTFSVKAAETGSMVPFCVDLVRRHAGILPKARFLMKAGEALLTYIRITRNNPRNLRVLVQQDDNRHFAIGMCRLRCACVVWHFDVPP